MSFAGFALWMLVPLGLAICALFVGYLAFEASRAKARASALAATMGPDPRLELERVNTEIGRAAAAARLTLEAARETVRKGTR